MASETNKNQGTLDNSNQDQVIFGAHLNQKDQALMTNENGGSIQTNNVLVLDTSNDESIEETTTAGDAKPIFVVPADLGDYSGGTGDNATATKTIADTEAGWVLKAGTIAEATVDGAVSIGEYLKTSSTAKKLTGTDAIAGTNPMPYGTCAIALEAATGEGVITVLLIPTYAPTFPRRATRFGDEFTLLTGTGPLTHQHQADQNYSFYTYNANAADADEGTCSLELDAATYTLSLLYVKSASGGKADWYYKHELDAAYTKITSTPHDNYSAAATYNVVTTESVTLAKPGRYTFKWKINGKNAASANYYCSLTKIWLKPSAD